MVVVVLCIYVCVCVCVCTVLVVLVAYCAYILVQNVYVATLEMYIIIHSKHSLIRVVGLQDQTHAITQHTHPCGIIQSARGRGTCKVRPMS